MRIALTHEFSWPRVRRGGERYLHELAASLARRQHDVTIIAGGSFGLSNEDGIRVIRLRGGGSTRPRARSFFLRGLRMILEARRFDVVHSLGPRDALMSLDAKRIRRGRRTLFTDLGNPIREWWSAHPDGDAQQRVAHEVDVYGCLSKFALDALEEQYGRRGALTPGGVRLDAFRPVAPRESAPTILYSGVLTEPRKGVATLLNAVAMLAEREPRVRLWLSGSGDATALLRAAPRAAVDRTEVLPLGRPGDQPERYSRAWVTALPSVDEAFGLALVESLACGTPIVAADDAALPELIEPEIGALAVPRDVASLADACAAALEICGGDERARETCRDAARRHDWDSSVTLRTEAAYLGDVGDA